MTLEYAVTKDAISLEGLWFSYGAGNHALKGISLSVASGSFTILFGPNGSGKTTLLKIINGLLTPGRGSVSIFGKEVVCESQRTEARRSIGYIPQQLGLVRNATVLKNVLMGSLSRINSLASILGVYPKHEIDIAQEFIDLVGLSHKIDEKIHRLSGGERRRVTVARALMQKPSIILADEISSNLDFRVIREVMDIMGEVKRNGTTIVMATHSLELTNEYGDLVVLMKEGTRVGEMKASDLTEEIARRMLA